MLGLFNKKKTQGDEVVLKIKGMHCTSCAINIDGELEDTEGVVEAKTSYAKHEVKVVYEAGKVKVEKLKKVIENLGYKVAD